MPFVGVMCTYIRRLCVLYFLQICFFTASVDSVGSVLIEYDAALSGINLGIVKISLNIGFCCTVSQIMKIEYRKRIQAASEYELSWSFTFFSTYEYWLLFHAHLSYCNFVPNFSKEVRVRMIQRNTIISIFIINLNIQSTYFGICLPTYDSIGSSGNLQC